MSGQPRISVLLPVRDGLPYLEECLESLANQSFRDFEIVAVDDGSTDGSRELLGAWAARDRRFRVLARRPAGLVAALNRGLADCRAPLVARMDADDRCDPRRLELQLAALEADRSLDVVSCLVSHFPDEEVGDGFRRYEEWLNALVEHEDILRERFIESPLPHPSVLCRRAVLLEVGGYRDVGFPEDYDLWLRLAASGARFAKVPEVLLHWREHGRRLTRTDPLYAVERFLACKARYLAAGPLAGADRVVVWGAGATGRRLAKHLQREGAALVAFLDVDPKKIGRHLRGLPIEEVERLPALLAGAGRAIVVTAVGSHRARGLIRARLADFGLAETRDYWCAA